MRYNESDRRIRAFLVRNPDSTAEAIRSGTGIPVSTINTELQKYKVGSHEEPRYEMVGYGLGPKGQPAQLWRVTSEPQASARRRLRSAVKRIAGVLSEHPELAGEAVTWVAAVAAEAYRARPRG